MKQQFLKNTIIIGIGRVSTQFIGLILLPLYTTFLRPSEYGAGDIIITYAALAIPIVTLSLEQGAFRLLVDSREDEAQKKQIISFVNRTVLLLCLAMWAVALIVAMLFSYDLQFILLTLLYITSAVFVSVLLWFARGLGSTVEYSKASILIGISSLALNIVLVALLAKGLTGMITALSVANLIGVGYLFFSLKLNRYISFTNTQKSINRELLSYSLPLTPNSISWWLINAVDRTIIAIFLGVAATGIYAVSAKFPAVLIGLFSIFWISWHESASQYINHKDRDIFFTKVANTSLSLFGTIALLIISLLSVFFNLIVESEFNEAYVYVPILMLSAIFSTMISLYGSIYAAKKTTRQVLNTTILSAIVNVIVMISLIHFINLYAAAIASVVAYLSMLIYRHYDIKKYVDIKINLSRIGILIFATSIVFSLYYVNNFYMNILSVIGVSLFGLIFNKSIIFSIKDLIWKKKLELFQKAI